MVMYRWKCEAHNDLFRVLSNRLIENGGDSWFLFLFLFLFFVCFFFFLQHGAVRTSYADLVVAVLAYFLQLKPPRWPIGKASRSASRAVDLLPRIFFKAESYFD